MPKPMYVWSGSAWVSVATEVESLATYATQSYANNAATVASGMKLLTPTSIAVGSGSGSVNSTGTVTVSAASSVSLNGIFTTDYKRYRVIPKFTSSAGADIDLRLRASGTDNTASSYFWEFSQANGGTVGGQRSSANRWYIAGGYIGTTGETNSILEIANPAQSVITQGLAQTTTNGESTTGIQLFSLGYLHNVASAFDGFTFVPSSGTISGTVSVYGYRE